MAHTHIAYIYCSSTYTHTHTHTHPPARVVHLLFHIDCVPCVLHNYSNPTTSLFILQHPNSPQWLVGFCLQIVMAALHITWHVTNISWNESRSSWKPHLSVSVVLTVGLVHPNTWSLMMESVALKQMGQTGWIRVNKKNHKRKSGEKYWKLQISPLKDAVDLKIWMP